MGGNITMGSRRIKYILSFIILIGLFSCEKPNNDIIIVQFSIENSHPYTLKYFNGCGIITHFEQHPSIDKKFTSCFSLHESDSIYFSASNGHPFKIWIWYDGSPQFYGSMYDSINIHKPIF